MPAIMSAIVACLIQILSRVFFDATPTEGFLIYFVSFIAFMMTFIVNKEEK